MVPLSFPLAEKGVPPFVRSLSVFTLCRSALAAHSTQLPWNHIVCRPPPTKSCRIISLQKPWGEGAVRTDCPLRLYAPLSHLESTPIRWSTSVDSNGLTGKLNRLDATGSKITALVLGQVEDSAVRSDNRGFAVAGSFLLCVL